VCRNRAGRGVLFLLLFDIFGIEEICGQLGRCDESAFAYRPARLRPMMQVVSFTSAGRPATMCRGSIVKNAGMAL